MSGWETVVTAVSAVLVALIGARSSLQIARLRAENAEQHAEGRALVAHVAAQVNELQGSVNDGFDRTHRQIEGVREDVSRIKTWQAAHIAAHRARDAGHYASRV